MNQACRGQEACNDVPPERLPGWEAHEEKRIRQIEEQGGVIVDGELILRKG